MSDILITDNNEALEVAKELQRAESAVRSMKKALQIYTKENGVVECEVTDVRIGYLPRDPVWDFKKDKENVEQLFYNLFFDKLDPSEFLSITSTNANKLAKIWSKEEMEIAGGYKKERSDTFRILKY